MTRGLTSRRRLLRPGGLAAAMGALLPLDSEARQEGGLLRAARRSMACRFEVIFPASGRSRMKAVHQALNRVRQLELQMTVFRDDSEISRLNQTAHLKPVQVETSLFRLLEEGVRIGEETGGAFDLASGSLTRCWGFWKREGRIPSDEELSRALASSGIRSLELDQEQCTVRYGRSGVEINLGGIGKGYALDRAGELLLQGGLTDFLFHGGHSSCLARGSAPGSENDAGWQVSVRHPLGEKRPVATIHLRDEALGMSGIGEHSFSANGVTYGHLIDPRTGRPARVNLSVAVLAPGATQADALSTAFFIMEPKEIEEYCRRHSEVGVLLVPQQDFGSRLKIIEFGLKDRTVEVHT